MEAEMKAELKAEMKAEIARWLKKDVGVRSYKSF
jgi:hypothetical protein